ncbi:MAG: glycosyltransferase [Verrucomicrobiota bacterium]
MRSILIVTRHTPLPWDDGAGAYLHDIASYLARGGFRVQVLWLAPHDHIRWKKIWRRPDDFDRKIKLHLPGAIRLGSWYLFPAVLWLPFQARTKDRIKRLLAKLGFRTPSRPVTAQNKRASAPPSTGWMSPPTESENALVEKVAERESPDVVVACYAWLCPIFQLRPLQKKVHVCLTYDVAWKRAALQAKNRGETSLPEITRSDESRWLETADLLIAISSADADEFRLYSAANVVVAPKAFLAQAGEFPVNTQRLLFVGSGNSFNVDGLNWFLERVWPRVRAHLPDLILDVCGSIGEAIASRPSGVIFHGRVSDLKPFYHRSGIVIVPLLEATGLNIKLVEAAAHGCAIVATPAPLEGAHFLEEAVIEAHDEISFADAVRRLVENPGERKTVANRCLTAVRDHLSPATCYSPLVTILSESRHIETSRMQSV